MLTTHYATVIKIVIHEKKARGDIPFTRFGLRFAQGYIIPSKSSFQTSFGENKPSHKLMAATRQ